MNKIYHILGVFILFQGSLCFTGSFTVQAQHREEVQTFDKSKWKNLVKDLKYQENAPKKDPPKQRASSRRGWGKINLSNSVKIILFTVLIVLLAALVIWIVSSNTQVKVRTHDFIQELNEDAAVTDLPLDLLRKHLEMEKTAGNFRKALRIYFLIILRTLHEKEFILWKKEKTNRQYILELKGRPFYTDFAFITRTYEMIWYGDKVFESSYLQESCGSFEKFLQNINQATFP